MVGWLTGLYSGVSPRRKLVRYFPRTCTKYLCRYANFIPSPQPARPYPLSRSPSQITPSLSPSLQNALQINVEVPTRVVLSVVQHEQYNDKRKKRKNKKRERERVEKTMEKAKIVLPMLYNGVKSNGVWRDYESDDGLDYRYVSTGKIWYFFVPCIWKRWMAGEIIIFWLGIDNLGLRQRGISSGQPVSEILPPLQTWQGWKLSPSPEFSWETLTLAEE